MACSGHTSTARPTATADFACPPPIGTRTLYTIAASDSIAEPQTCARSQPDEAFIRVTGRGTRSFSIAPLGKATGCTSPDADCETVDLNAFLQTVGGKLRTRGVDLVSTMGMGSCGKVNSGVSWEDRHMSITIYHWKHADTAVTVLDEELRAWNVGQSYEIAVEHMKCAQPAAL